MGEVDGGAGPACSCSARRVDEADLKLASFRSYGSLDHSGQDAVHAPSLESIFSRAELVEQLHEHSVAAQDAAEYYRASVIRKARNRIPAVGVTFAVELLPAFVIFAGASELQAIVGQSKAALFAGFITIVSAISGNVGLQSSSLTTRAISHGFVRQRDWVVAFGQEVASAALMALVMGFVAFALASVWSGDIYVGLCIGMAQTAAMVIAGVTGTAAPLIFKFVLDRDPGCWAGPLETAVQDIIGTTCLFYFAVAFLRAMYGTPFAVP